MSTAVTTAERNVASAEAYYGAMKEKDLAAMAKHLHPDVQFVGPMAEFAGKEKVLEAARGLHQFITDIRMNARFGSQNQAMLAFDMDLTEPLGMCRSAVLMTFKDSLIAKIELFYDARPFEKNLKKDAIFASR